MSVVLAFKPREDIASTHPTNNVTAFEAQQARKAITAKFNAVKFVNDLGFDPDQHRGLLEVATYHVSKMQSTNAGGTGAVYQKAYEDRVALARGGIDALTPLAAGVFPGDRLPETIACILSGPINIPMVRDTGARDGSGIGAARHSWKQPVARQALDIWDRIKGLSVVSGATPEVEFLKKHQHVWTPFIK